MNWYKSAAWANRRPASSADARPTGGAHDNNTDVIVQTVHPSLSPTHYCVDCGALWRQCDDFSMNLRSPSCCDNCNNAPVGPQIRPLAVADFANARHTDSYADAGDNSLNAGMKSEGHT